MSKVLRFIHTADIHLGSFLHCGGDLSYGYRGIIKNATYEAFDNICNAAIKYNVNFVLIAGDLFDREARSIEASRFFVERCAKLNEKGIKVYVIAGNHDPLQEEDRLFSLPENVYIFGSEHEVKRVLDDSGEVRAIINGQSYKKKFESRKMYESFIGLDNGWSIGLLHTELNSSGNNYVPCTVNDLRSVKGVDYWALGHIHQCRLVSEDHPVIIYPGIPQGRDFGEEGLGGCILVEMESDRLKNVKFRYIPTSPIVLKRVEIFIDEDSEKAPENISELEELIKEKTDNLINHLPQIPEGLKLMEGEDIGDYLKGYVVQWIIRGRSELHDTLMEQEEEITKDLTESLRKEFGDRSPFVWTDSVVIRTGKPLPPIQILKRENPLFQEMDELVTQILTDQKMKKELIQFFGKVFEWQEDHENINEEKLQLNEELLKEIVYRAEEMVIDKLLEGRYRVES